MFVPLLGATQGCAVFNGLAGAVSQQLASKVCASCSPYIAVIGADFQHEERLLPCMLEALESRTLDLVIGSRYVPGGGFGDLSNGRIRISGSRRVSHTLSARPRLPTR